MSFGFAGRHRVIPHRSGFAPNLEIQLIIWQGPRPGERSQFGTCRIALGREMLWMDEIRSHHLETMVETIVDWQLQRGHHSWVSSVVQGFVH